jgi:hypothetical protein
MTGTVPSVTWGAPWRAAVLPLLVLPLFSCGTTEPLAETHTTDGAARPTAETPALAVSFAGGIPFGLYALPVALYGSTYNGALRNAPSLDSAGTFLSTLAAIKARGGKVVLQLTGNERHFLDAKGHFDFAAWKARVDVFRKYNFTSYITDGTIIAHFLIDEPNDASNFGGQAVSGATVEAMAKYSKSIWPTLPTVTRTESTYLLKWPGYHYLDAAWAQYVYRKGDVNAFITRNIADAKKLGLQLVTGLNINKGGPNKSRMTPAQIKTWGSALLTSTYPCAFVSWSYLGAEAYVATTSVKSAMSFLRAKAQNRALKSCRRV